MFSKETITYYRSIHAPNSLKNKVLANAEVCKRRQKQNWKNYLAIAACLVLLCAASINFLYTPAAELTVNGTVVDTTPVVVSAPMPIIARTAPFPSDHSSLRINFQLSTKNQPDIRVSIGEIIPDIENHTTFTWVIPNELSETENAVLSLRTARRETNYTLFPDETGTWFLKKIQ